MRFMPSDICMLCDEPGGIIPNLCDACARELPSVHEPCVACGASSPPHVNLCGGCSTRRPPVDRTICAVAYASPVDYLIGRLKFSRDLRVVPVLAGLLRRAVAGETGVDWLVPVPITPARLRERGFNQALEIAQALSKSRDAPITRRVHRRHRGRNPAIVTDQFCGQTRECRGRFRGTWQHRGPRRNRRRRRHHRRNRQRARAMPESRRGRPSGCLGGRPDSINK